MVTAQIVGTEHVQFDSISGINSTSRVGEFVGEMNKWMEEAKLEERQKETELDYECLEAGIPGRVKAFKKCLFNT